jgi:hypothetical protein
MKLRVTGLFLLILGVTTFQFQLDAQVVQSEKVKIRINTKETPVVEAPDIEVLEPRELQQGVTFVTDLPAVPLIIRLSNPVPGAKVLVNNVEIKPTANGDIFTHSYAIVKGSANLLNIALVVDNKPVKDLSYSLLFRETTRNLSPFATPEGKYYALIIANNTYNVNSGMMNLKRPIADATALKDILISRYTFDWANVTTLYDRSKLDVEVTLEELQKRLFPEDNLLIFYAGHGIMDEESDIGYWLLSDATRSRVTWLSNSTITDFIKACKARHVLLIADACYAGSIYSARGVLDNATPAIRDLIRSKSRKAITSGGTTQVADESKFAQILVEQLRTNMEQALPSSQLYHLLLKPVLANSQTSPRWGPISNVGDDNGDFVFFLK